MTVLLDTNVVLDILLNRRPWYNEAALIFGLSEKKLITCFISASSITDIFYLAQKEHGIRPAQRLCRKIPDAFTWYEAA
jgi:predicted nucleic acid-binding protein